MAVFRGYPGLTPYIHNISIYTLSIYICEEFHPYDPLKTYIHLHSTSKTCGDDDDDDEDEDAMMRMMMMMMRMMRMMTMRIQYDTMRMHLLTNAESSFCFDCRCLMHHVPYAHPIRSPEHSHASSAARNELLDCHTWVHSSP